MNQLENNAVVKTAQSQFIVYNEKILKILNQAKQLIENHSLTNNNLSKSTLILTNNNISKNIPISTNNNLSKSTPISTNNNLSKSTPILTI